MKAAPNSFLLTAWAICGFALAGLIHLYLDLPLKNNTCPAGIGCGPSAKEWASLGIIAAAAAFPVTLAVGLIRRGSAQIRTWHGGRIALLWLIFVLSTGVSVVIVITAFEIADVRVPHPAALTALGVGVGAALASILTPISATWIWLGRVGRPPHENTSNRVA